MTGETGPSLPILDLQRFDFSGDERARFLVELRAAARDYGFFYLVGHGVEDRLTQTVLSLSRRFFRFPRRKNFRLKW